MERGGDEFSNLGSSVKFEAIFYVFEKTTKKLHLVV